MGAKLDFLLNLSILLFSFFSALHGRDPTLGSGTPWISTRGERLAYRTAHQICAESFSAGKVICWSAAPGVDPLLAKSLPEIPESPAFSEYLRSAILANESLIQSGDYGSLGR